MRFLFVCLAICNLYCSEIIQVSRFADVHTKIIGELKAQLQQTAKTNSERIHGSIPAHFIKPSEVAIFVDIDNTLLTGGRGSVNPVQVVDSSAIDHINDNHLKPVVCFNACKAD